MNFDCLLTPAHFDYIAKVANCKTEEIQVWAIPDSLAISYWFTTKKEAGQMYKDYAKKKGKLINNPFSWNEFEGFKNRLILFPGGHAVQDTPFHPKDEMTELEAIQEAVKGSNFEVKILEL